MDEQGRRRTIRLLAGLGAGIGAVLLVRPRWVVARLCPELPSGRRWVVRLLGVRMLLQHGAVLVEPHPTLVRAAAAVDLAHAASMVPLVGSPSYGRAARLSGALSGGLAAANAAVSTSGAPRAPRP